MKRRKKKEIFLVYKISKKYKQEIKMRIRINEYIDKDLLKKVQRASNNDITEKIRKQLNKLKVNESGYHIVTYNQKESRGRMYAPSGLQGIKSEIRKYLCNNEYYDIDIASCAQTIQYNYMTSRNIETPEFLEEYMRDSENTRKKYGIEKTELLIMICSSTEPKNEKLKEYHSVLYLSLIHI